MAERDAVIAAIRANWGEDTCTPGQFSAAVPEKGQCDASSFVAWRYLGGDLVLAKVFVGGVETEHHYWNRIDGQDLDLTRGQFTGTEEIREVAVHPSAMLAERMPEMRPELLGRIELLSERVATDLGEPPLLP